MASTRKNRISPVDLSTAVDVILAGYGEEVTAVMDKAIEDVSTGAVKKLQAVKEFAPWGNPSGAYSASWTQEDRQTGRFKTVSTIYNEDHYQLPHLLEFGHANRDGGRTAAYPHIRQVNDWCETEIVREINRGLRE